MEVPACMVMTWSLARPVMLLRVKASKMNSSRRGIRMYMIRGLKGLRFINLFVSGKDQAEGPGAQLFFCLWGPRAFESHLLIVELLILEPRHL